MDKICKHNFPRRYCNICLLARIKYLESLLRQIRAIEVDAWWNFSEED